MVMVRPVSDAGMSSESARWSCALCGADRFATEFPAVDFDAGLEAYRLERCCHCGLVHTHPPPDAATLSRCYASAYYGGGSRGKFGSRLERILGALAARRARVLHDAAKERGPGDTRPIRVLDIGCGRGTLLQALDALGCECHGLERSDSPDLLSHQRIRLHREPLANLGLDDGYFDLVVIWHALEHLDAPAETMREVARVLAAGGILMLSVPNFASWQARWFREHWFHLDLPRHLFHFTPSTLRRLLTDHGVQVERQSTFSLEQNLYGFVQSALNRFALSAPPNRLYSLLKRDPVSGTARGVGALLGWGLAAGLLLAPAMLELALSALAGTGATLTVRARRAG